MEGGAAGGCSVMHGCQREFSKGEELTLKVDQLGTRRDEMGPDRVRGELLRPVSSQHAQTQPTEFLNPWV